MIYQSATSVSATSSAALDGAGRPSVDEATAKALIDKVNDGAAIQSSFEATQAIKIPQNEGFLAFLRAIGSFFRAIAKLMEPLGPILPYLAILLILLAAGFLLSPLVRLMLRQNFERFWPSRHRLHADAAWVPTQAAVSALLSEIDAFAAKGEYDAAVHLLLYRTLADLNTRRSNLVKPHFTARDILSHPLLPAKAHEPFSRIVHWVELSFFAGIPVGQAGFESCRAAYVAFLTSQGLREPEAASALQGSPA